MSFLNLSLDAALPTFLDVEAAARRLAGQAVVTPLLESEMLSAIAGRRVLVKAEPLQRTGSFKFRGAYNRISRIPQDERSAGVVAYSSGNHAQAVALAAKLHNMPARIVMPKDAPTTKIRATRAYGAQVVLYDRDGEDREMIAREIVAETGATLVAPYEDFHVIAGQGTCGLEMAEQVREKGVEPDAVIICTGGGGLLSGCSLALNRLLPRTEIFAAEPLHYNDWQRSLAAGRIIPNTLGPKSLCDALLSPQPGRMTFTIASAFVAGGLAVTEAEVRHAVRLAFRHLKLVLEPGGAVALAAAITDKLPESMKTIVVTASGGNVDQELFAAILAEDFGGAARKPSQ